MYSLTQPYKHFFEIYLSFLSNMKNNYLNKMNTLLDFQRLK